MLLNLKNSFILLPKDTKILNEDKRVKMNWPQNLIFFKLIKWWVWLTEWHLQILLNLKTMRIKWRVYKQNWYKKILSFLKDSFWCLRDWVSWRKVTNEHILYQQMKYLSLFLDLNVYNFVLNEKWLKVGLKSINWLMLKTKLLHKINKLGSILKSSYFFHLDLSILFRLRLYLFYLTGKVFLILNLVLYFILSHSLLLNLIFLL